MLSALGRTIITMLEKGSRMFKEETRSTNSPSGLFGEFCNPSEGVLEAHFGEDDNARSRWNYLEILLGSLNNLMLLRSSVH